MQSLSRLMVALVASVFAVPQAAPAQDFAAAGVPAPLGRTGDYDAIFATLHAAGITAFFPTFQFVEVPEPETLGREVDFMPPCHPDDPAFAAMRRHGIRLIAAASLLYDPDAPFPARAADPLAALIACTGRDGLLGILSYDEPGYSGISPDRTAALFAHVRDIAPDLPVLMVHGPLVIEPGRHDTAEAQRAYLDAVVAHSRHADIVGFSTYPVPPEVARMGAPGAGLAVVDHVTAARGYMQWLSRALPDTDRMAVLQVFNYADQVTPGLLARIAPAALRARLAPPNEAQLEQMARESIAGGAGLIIWYGANFAKTADDPGWLAMLAVSRRLSGAP
ncbi:MAG: hypothetical protein GW886_09040 [Rhodobacterales bacterium]|nr:hypothetical protein [Rhodobacterales bacterium]NCT11460.1 hypothetical protein [Rhodobacterales bacterium]